MLDFEPIDRDGVSQASIREFLKDVERYRYSMHSVLIFRDGKLCYEHYWAPFTQDTPHRMYSVTKSFVSIAVGCLADEGKLDLDDPIVKFFPDKQPETVHPWMGEQTVRDMLKMSTSTNVNWFQPGVTDRAKYYFSVEPTHPSGTIFDYDSTGSYILGCLVERVSGKPLLAYLKEKVLDTLGGFENAEILKTPDGTPWGDSALVCTPRAMARFAQCVMDMGRWGDKQLISRDYMEKATSKQVDNNVHGPYAHNHFGYGYQIWRGERNSFSFHGMGGQYAIMVPEKNFLFVCTGDNQINSHYAEMLFRSVFEKLVDPLYAEDGPAEPREGLPIVSGEATSPFAAAIDGAWYACAPNAMGITRFSLSFAGEGGVLRYTNAQGDKELPFGMKKNVMTLFPELGYSNDRGNVHERTDFRYRCAVSAGWVEETKLQIYVQVVDRYLGELCITLGFRGPDVVGVRMNKTAEDFFQTYEGWMGATRVR